MLRASLLCLRAKATPKSALRSLRQQLTGLKAANAAMAAQLTERRRLVALMRRRRWEQQQGEGGGDGAGPSASASSSASSSTSTAAGATAAAAAAAAEAERLLRAEARRLLPRNSELESAIAFTLRENRDARTELEFTRHLLGSTLLSLASPVGAWDPYDVKPQVFALDNYLALPVFTSPEYLELFCRRFGFVVRDPSGVLWADGRSRNRDDTDDASPRLLPLPDGVTRSMWWGKESQGQKGREGGAGVGEEQEATMATGKAKEAAPQSSPPPHQSAEADAAEVSTMGPDAASLFDDLADPVPLPSAPLPLAPTEREGGATSSSRKKGKKGRPSKAAQVTARRGRRQRRRRQGERAARGEDARDSEGEEPVRGGKAAAEAAAKEAFWASVAQVSPFHLKQATPLPTFGPFVYPFFVGYFADVNTLLHNAAIVPDKVDIVLNPTSPTEFVLAREATDRVLHHDQLLLLAYQRVEKELQREFSVFFSRYCPEVTCVKSACIPHPLDRRAATRALKASREFSSGENPLQDQRARTQLLRESTYTGGVGYDIALLLRSTDLAATYRSVQWGKEQCLLMGHPDLDLLPEEAAAPYVAEAAQTFYVARESPHHPSSHGQDSSSDGDHGGRGLGVFRKLGTSQTVNVAQPADSYYHDPTNAYTEAHAVFTEELKVKRGQR